MFTAFAEILGCYCVYAWLRLSKSPWLIVPALVSLALFAYCLTLLPSEAGRVYAAYGGVYVAASLVWLWAVEGVKPGPADFVGVALCLIGTTVIVAGGIRT